MVEKLWDITKKYSEPHAVNVVLVFYFMRLTIDHLQRSGIGIVRSA